MSSPLELLAGLRRRILVHRRMIAALCAGTTVWLTLHVLSAEPPLGTVVITAAHDLDSGTTLTAEDLTRTRLPAGAVPAGSFSARARLVGRTLLAPLTQGSPLTARQVLGRTVLAGYPGDAAVGLRIPDQDAAALLRPGDRVDVVASDPQADDKAELLVEGAIVLAVPEPDPDASSTGTESGGRLVLFAVPSASAQHVAAVGASRFLTVIWNR